MPTSRPGPRKRYRAIDVLKKSKLPIVVPACPAELTSLRVAEALRAEGLPDARALTGGWAEWFNGGNPVEPAVEMRFAPEYVEYVLNENFNDARLFLGPLMSIHYAHLAMLAAPGIVKPDDAHALQLRSTRFPSLTSGARRMTADVKTCSSISIG